MRMHTFPSLVDELKLPIVLQHNVALQTASLFRPLARRALMTRRPFFVAIRERNPWVRLRGVL